MFLPLFLFCNIRPSDDNVTPVLLESDAAYLVVMILFSVSNGYLGSICMISAPQRVRGEEAATAANLMVGIRKTYHAKQIYCTYLHTYLIAGCHVRAWSWPRRIPLKLLRQAHLVRRDLN